MKIIVLILAAFLLAGCAAFSKTSDDQIDKAFNIFDWLSPSAEEKAKDAVKKKRDEAAD